MSFFALFEIKVSDEMLGILEFVNEEATTSTVSIGAENIHYEFWDSMTNDKTA